MLHRSCNMPAGRQPPPAGSTVVPPTSGRGEEEEVQTDRTSCLALDTPLYTSNSLTLTFNTCSHYHPTFPSSPTPSPSSHLPLFPHSHPHLTHSLPPTSFCRSAALWKNICESSNFSIPFNTSAASTAHLPAKLSFPPALWAYQQ